VNVLLKSFVNKYYILNKFLIFHKNTIIINKLILGITSKLLLFGGHTIVLLLNNFENSNFNVEFIGYDMYSCIESGGQFLQTFYCS